MDQELKAIIERMTTDLGQWLDKPSATTRQIQQVREQIQGLKGELGAGAVGDTLKQLEKAETQAGRVRRRQAADAIAELCRTIGVSLTPKDPPRRKVQTRKPRKQAAGSSAGQEPPQKTDPPAGD